MDIAHYIAHPDELNHETLYELRRLVAVFPAYHAARILYLRNLFLLHDPNFDMELRRAAVMLPDRGILFNMTQQQPKTEKTQPLPSTTNTESCAPGPQKKYNATMQLLDDFLNASPKPAKRQTKIDPTVDYMSYLMQNEEEEGDHHEPLWAETRLGTPTAAQSRQDSLIDHFIDTHSERTTLSDDPMMPEGIIDENGRTAAHAIDDYAEQGDADDVSTRNAADEPDESDASFTETLARAYIKQQKYERAAEMLLRIQHTNAARNNPYYADQVRFLQKVIINDKHRKDRKQS